MRALLVFIVACAASSGPESGRNVKPEYQPPASASARTTVGAQTDLVDVTKLDPSIQLDIRYATSNNFTGVAVYPIARCLLRRDVATRLIAAHRELRKQGFGLLVWDCYRPISVQQHFWRLVPDPRYVAEPIINNGVAVSGSKHNRGAAVDLSLIAVDGRAVAMPTDYDDFSERAHRTSTAVPKAARKNALILERAMTAQGFAPLPTEWWHFDGPNWRSYPLSDEPLR